MGGAVASLLNEKERERDDVLESYLDKKGHPKDTPGSERRSRITIEHRLARLISAPMLDFQTLPPKQSSPVALRIDFTFESGREMMSGQNEPRGKFN